MQITEIIARGTTNPFNRNAHQYLCFIVNSITEEGDFTPESGKEYRIVQPILLNRELVATDYRNSQSSWVC